MVDCDSDSSSSSCEKPVSTLSKTVIPVCIFGLYALTQAPNPQTPLTSNSIFITALIVFVIIMRKHKQKEAAAEEKARQKYQDLGFDDDEPQSRRNAPRKPQAPLRPSPNNNRQSFGPVNEGQYQANPNMYLRNEGSTFQLSQLHPSLDNAQKSTASKEFV